MKKRIVSMLLLLCLVVTAIPVFVLPTAAIAGLGEGENEATVTVEFRKADWFPKSGKGTLVATRTYTTVNGLLTSAIELPTEAECSAKSLNAADIIGWYETTPTGTPITPQAYVGNYYFAENTTLTFYPYTKSSTIAFASGAQNLPLYSGNSVYATRGGWEIGYYDSKAVFKNYAWVNTTPMFIIASSGYSGWTYGGAYLGSSASSSIITSNNGGYVSALQWNAIANGTVSIDIASFYVYGQDAAVAEGTDATVFVAIAKNDKLIWPASVQGKTVVTKDFEAAGYQKFNLVGKDRDRFPGVGKNTFVTAYLSDNNAETANDGIIDGIEVAAGDEITIIFGRGNAIKVYDPSPTVTYTTLGTTLRADITTSMNEPLVGATESRPFDEKNTPIVSPNEETVEDTKDITVTYPGDWDFIVYNSGSAIDGNPLVPTMSSVNDDYITVQDYGESSSNCPVLFISPYHGNFNYWGPKWSIGINSGMGGYRYTAPKAGYASFSFDAFKSATTASLAGFLQKLRLAIYVDGQKVFPTNADWFTPYNTAHTSQTDVSASINDALRGITVFLEEGSTVEFILDRTDSNIWNGIANYIRPVVSLKEPDAAFTATASLGTSLTLTLGSTSRGASFAPKANGAYIDAASLNFSIDDKGAGFTVTATGATAVISGIAAKQMTDKISYTLTGDVKKPNGTAVEDVVLATGSISVADYLQWLLAKNFNQVYNDLAITTLNYGAAAQVYFNYKTDELANEGITDVPSFTLEAPKSALAFTGSGAYKFSGATLLLEDTVILKLLVDAKGEPAADYADYYVKASDSNVKVPLVQRDGDENGSHLKALVEIPFSKLGTTFTFAVYNGEGVQVSHSLTYSVDTYAARTTDLAEQADLVAAIRAAGIASANYVNLYTVNNLTKLISTDYSKGNGEDANGHTLRIGGTPVYADGYVSFDGTNALGYTLTAADKAAMKNSVTIETVLKIGAGMTNATGGGWGYGALISSMEGGGFGLCYSYKEDRLFFDLSPTTADGKKGTAVSVGTSNIATETPLHIVATYNGEILSLYVNGELVASAACTGDIFHAVVNGPHRIYVASDTNGSGGRQTSSDCDVAYFNLYAEGVTAEQVATMYAAAQAR